MKAVIQVVEDCSVTVADTVVAQLPKGLLVYLGVSGGDTTADAAYAAEKISRLRIFPDEKGKMNRSVMEMGYGICVVSQFTLCGNTSKGRRPSFEDAASPLHAENVYEHFIQCCVQCDIPCEKGVFGGHMRVKSVNIGPVTFVIETPGKTRQ